MKKQLFILGIALSLMTSACYMNHDFTGDKNVVRKGKDVETFQTIELNGSINNMKLYFTQDSAAPLIRIEVDSNILDKMAIFVKNNKLTVKTKKEYDHLHLSPSVCNIYCNAAALTEILIFGSGDVICQTPLTGEALTVYIAGSGNFTAEQPSSITYVSTSISGSGDITFSGNGKTAEFRLSGSGDIKLKGNYDKVEGRISGSGNVDALQCAAKQLEAKISGSGNISAEVLESLSIRISGSGDFRYKGNPARVDKNITGSGEVIQVN